MSFSRKKTVVRSQVTSTFTSRNQSQTPSSAFVARARRPAPLANAGHDGYRPARRLARVPVDQLVVPAHDASDGHRLPAHDARRAFLVEPRVGRSRLRPRRRRRGRRRRVARRLADPRRADDGRGHRRVCRTEDGTGKSTGPSTGRRRGAFATGRRATLEQAVERLEQQIPTLIYGNHDIHFTF